MHVLAVCREGLGCASRMAAETLNLACFNALHTLLVRSFVLQSTQMSTILVDVSYYFNWRSRRCCDMSACKRPSWIMTR
jgi:hypothetical protein